MSPDIVKYKQTAQPRGWQDSLEQPNPVRWRPLLTDLHRNLRRQLNLHAKIHKFKMLGAQETLLDKPC